ncbi:hypothetical protein GCM10009636_08470 [Arthrobacter koreensis]
MSEFTVSRGKDSSLLFLPFSAMSEIDTRSWNALGELIVAARAQGLLANESTCDRTSIPGGWNMIASNQHFELLSGVAHAAVEGDYQPLVALRDGRAAPLRGTSPPNRRV